MGISNDVIYVSTALLTGTDDQVDVKLSSHEKADRYY